MSLGESRCVREEAWDSVRDTVLVKLLHWEYKQCCTSYALQREKEREREMERERERKDDK